MVYLRRPRCLNFLKVITSVITTFDRIVLASIDNEGVLNVASEPTSNDHKKLTISGRVPDTNFGGVKKLTNREP
jgi:hypothetical protein